MAWRDLFHRNLSWKIISLLLAAIVWLTYQSEAGKRLIWAQNLGIIPPTREFIRHPVNVITLNGDTRKFKIEPDEVGITVKGDRNSLLQLSSQNIRAVVDLAKMSVADPSTNSVQVYLPPDVTLVEVNPSTVRVEVVKP